MTPLCDADFSRALQIAFLRPITAPRRCECGKVIDPVGFHFMHCRFVHQSYTHDLIKEAIASTVKKLLTPEVSNLSVQMEKRVSQFYPLRSPLEPEGSQLFADIVLMLFNNAQQTILITDVSSVLARKPNVLGDFNVALDERSRAKRRKYGKYSVPAACFHAITVGRTNVLSADALRFCECIDESFTKAAKAGEKVKAAISRAVTVGVARTSSTAIRRAQLAAFNARAISTVPNALFLINARQESIFPLAATHAPPLARTLLPVPAGGPGNSRVRSR